VRVPGLRIDSSLDDLPWRETRDPGVQWLALHLEEPDGTERSPRRRGAATVLIRMAPGSGYARHRHVGSEDVLVLQGGYRDEWGEHRAGAHVHYPAGSEHSPRALGKAGAPDQEPCVLFACAPGGIELLESLG